MIVADLQRMDLTAIVDSTTALVRPAGASQALAANGVNVASGGRGDGPTARGHETDPTLWTRPAATPRPASYSTQLIGRTGDRAGRPAGGSTRGT